MFCDYTGCGTDPRIIPDFNQTKLRKMLGFCKVLFKKCRIEKLLN